MSAAAEQSTAQTAAERGRRKSLVGRVVNDTASPGRMKQTVVVEVVRSFRDPVYGKYVRRKKKFYAHDEKHEYRTGDTIEIEEHRPLSKLKRWVVTKLITRPEEV
ncbi:MAG: 30S ribosomal protein S17 [Deltaproteobacteria bacterium]|nr:30S ribosomal protein S17 [Deltaproteobacteria bacterium]